MLSAIGIRSSSLRPGAARCAYQQLRMHFQPAAPEVALPEGLAEEALVATAAAAMTLGTGQAAATASC